MTPFLREVYKKALLIDSPLAGWLENTANFDFTNVLDLLEQTADALNPGPEAPAACHGGLLVMPDEFVWVEFFTENTGRVGLLMQQDDFLGDIGVLTVGRDSLETYPSTIRLLPNEEFLVVVYGNEMGRAQTTAAYYTYMAAAALLILNAPYGVEKRRVPVHRGHAREAKKRGSVLREDHVIFLDKTKAPPEETPTGRAGFHKAFHFVRGHIRRLSTERITQVKAHWRGDPRLGVLTKAEYRFKGGSKCD